MYEGISPKILQFLKTLKYITELYHIKHHQNRIYIWQCKHQTYNLTTPDMFINLGKSWFGPSISLILLFQRCHMSQNCWLNIPKNQVASYQATGWMQEGLLFTTLVNYSEEIYLVGWVPPVHLHAFLFKNSNLNENNY